VRTGLAGISIEDSTGDPRSPLFDFPLAVERIRAARRAIDESGTGVLLTGRSEGFIAGRPDLGETIRRLLAYAEAGAECLYAPGIRAREGVLAVVKAVAPRPVNVLVHDDFTTVADMAEAGVRRISVGGALARAAWTGFLQAAREIAERGTFSSLARNVTGTEMESLVDPHRSGSRRRDAAPVRRECLRVPMVGEELRELLALRVSHRGAQRLHLDAAEGGERSRERRVAVQ
jgi:methylisocitrate lyase